jgi:hypothetical protein
MAGKKGLADSVRQSLAQSRELAADAEIARLRSEIGTLRGRYKAALGAIDAERARADSIASLSGIKAAPLAGASSRSRGRQHSASVIVLLSDWHCEETVDPATVNFLNSFNLDVCDQRIAELTERFSALLEHERRLAKIDRVVVWLGGDFITGAIHEDCAELAQLSPLAALRFAGERIRAFIDRVADQAKTVIVATNSGNHGRTTPKLRIGTELEHSFEQHLYLSMAAAERRKNVSWQVGTGYLNYVPLDDFLVRFHHGHAIRYSGAGVGGITIPVNKSIAGWDKIRPASLTCFGHYHQFQWLRAGRYVANGSLIGHSAFAQVVMKGSYEPPCQSLIVVDHGRNEVTKALPIFCDRDLQRRGADAG